MCTFIETSKIYTLNRFTIKSHFPLESNGGRCSKYYIVLIFFESIFTLIFCVPFRNKKKFVAVGFRVCTTKKWNGKYRNVCYGYSSFVTPIWYRKNSDCLASVGLLRVVSSYHRYTLKQTFWLCNDNNSLLRSLDNDIEIHSTSSSNFMWKLHSCFFFAFPICNHFQSISYWILVNVNLIWFFFVYFAFLSFQLKHVVSAKSDCNPRAKFSSKHAINKLYRWNKIVQIKNNQNRKNSIKYQNPNRPNSKIKAK